MAEDKVTCRRCQHYFITWEPKTPHGCRVMGFKSQLLPSIVVKKDSGVPCQAFVEKRPQRS